MYRKAEQSDSRQVYRLICQLENRERSGNPIRAGAHRFYIREGMRGFH